LDASAKKNAMAGVTDATDKSGVLAISHPLPSGQKLDCKRMKFICD
jgi:hypothetical protein